jgi:hypothetical protein
VGAAGSVTLEEARLDSGSFEDAFSEGGWMLSLVGWFIELDELQPWPFEDVVDADGSGDPGALGLIVSDCCLIRIDEGFRR